MRPLYINDCFAWLHPAEGARGVVICPAFGVEELCTHRFMRHLGDQLAEAGMPTVRIDYQGTGNSLGGDLDPLRVQAWLDSILQAVAWLRREMGVAEVALVGFRLGSLLATEAARQLSDIHSLVLLAPVNSGKNYLREMRALGSLIEQTARVVTPPDAPPLDGIDVAGFPITSSTMNDLLEIDLLKLAQPPAGRVLLLGRPDVAADKRLTTHLQGLGCAAEQGILAGLADLEWNSTFAELPPDAFLPAVEWLRANSPNQKCVQPILSTLSTALEASSWREVPIQFGPDGVLFGVHCAPVQQQESKEHTPIVLFINHGANHHVGWARMHVNFARQFAAQGIATLRVDFSGVGDSPAHEGRSENELYGRYLQRDIHVAVDWLCQQGYRYITLIGHCTGAHLCFYSTRNDQRVSNMVMLNLQRFFWDRGATLKDARRQTGIRSVDWYWRSMRSPRTWGRLIRGDIDVSTIAFKIMQGLSRRFMVATFTVFGPLVGKETLSRKVVRWLRELRDRGTRVLMVYCSGDGGLEEVATYLGPRARRVRSFSNVELHMIDGADHNITPAWAQQKYWEILLDFIRRGAPRKV